MADSGVDATSIAYEAMKDHWPLIDALLGGTPEMRAGRTTWLPMEPKEETPAYEVRLARSFLYGAFRDTISALVAKPFSKSVTVVEPKGGMPEQLQAIPPNVDREGSDLTQYARNLYRRGIERGMAGTLVDYPSTGLGPRGVTLAAQRQLDIRPYFVAVPVANLLGYRTMRDASGRKQLTEIRIKETAVEPDGKWGEKEVTQIRVIRAPVETETGTWEIWRKADNANEWTLKEEGAHTYPGVPFTPYYTNQVGYLQALPPLEDLAYLNLQHWQSSSDQRNILRFVRFAMLAATGITPEEKEEGFIVGPKQILYSTSDTAKFGYVEHTGAGVAAGRQDLLDLQAAMEVLGLQPLVERSGNVTATGKVLDEGKKFATAQLWVRSLENHLLEAMEIAGKWIEPGFELPDDYRIDIFSDFALSSTAAADAEWLLKARQAKQIDQRTFLTEARRRGKLHELTDVDEVIGLIEEEQKEMADLFAPVGAPAPGQGAGSGEGDDETGAAAEE